jgi:hypothetical protein
LVVVVRVVLVPAVQKVQTEIHLFFQLLLLLVAVVVVVKAVLVKLVQLVGRVVEVFTELAVVTLPAVLERRIKDLGGAMVILGMVLLVVVVLAHRE